MTQSLRIAIATAGRFHVLDLARELHALGHDIRFYSYVPKNRAKFFGLPAECHVSLLPFVAPLLFWQAIAPNLGAGLRERLIWAVLNRAVIWRLAPCDVFICMSGIYLEAAEHARRRHGAHVALERGSMHILAQDEILSNVPGAKRPGRSAIVRELKGYVLADQIMVPSAHVAASFARDPEAWRKVTVIPYGVDTDLFRPSAAPAPRREVVFVTAGTWSLQKGSDVLARAIKQVPGARLVHVGTVGDVPFPSYDSRFEHLDKVDQSELPAVYATADAFVLASRQDGFGLVIAQALACGLPVVCSDRTGGPDLRHTPTLGERICVTPADDAGRLTEVLNDVRTRLLNGPPYPSLTDADRETLSWSTYGRRYAERLVVARTRGD